MVDADLAPLLTAALAGGREQARELVAGLPPVIRRRVWRVLQRSGRARGQTPAQELDDIVQEIFVVLFEDGAKALRAWDPARGLSLAAFVGLVAERQAISLMRSRKRNPWGDELSGLSADGDAIEDAA